MCLTDGTKDKAERTRRQHVSTHSCAHAHAWSTHEQRLRGQCWHTPHRFPETSPTQKSQLFVHLLGCETPTQHVGTEDHRPCDAFSGRADRPDSCLFSLHQMTTGHSSTRYRTQRVTAAVTLTSSGSRAVHTWAHTRARTADHKRPSTKCTSRTPSVPLSAVLKHSLMCLFICIF